MLNANANANVDLGMTYDAIIVGGGPAGCVLASRLSEEKEKLVLLIEAGPEVAAPGTEHPDVLDPFCLMASYNPAFHWAGLVAEASQHDDARRMPLPFIQGFGVGGASNINGMGADRGLPGDYDAWCNLGADGWGWKDVLPYFTKLERDLDFPTSPSHGAAGPMPVRRLPRANWAPFTAALGAAIQRRGFAFLEDYITDFREGFGSVPTNCLPQRRVSASMAYLNESVRRRANLTIAPNVKVEQLSLNGQRADGVLVRLNGATKLVRGRQIILSCGAIQSPAVLMRSGIGPGGHLSHHDIRVLKDLPGVGANLQNHPSVSLTTYLRPAAAQPDDNLWLLQNWMRFSSHHPGCEANDMHLMAFNKCAWHALGQRTGTIAVSVLNAYSKGCVELAGADASVLPRIRFNALGDTRDFERLVMGLRFALELLADPAVASLRGEIFLPDKRLVGSLSRRSTWNLLRARTIASILDLAPLRQALLASSRIDPKALLADEHALREFVRAHAGLQFHVCGTCRIGRADDRDAVVDGGGRVHGVAALRIVDASIFPTIPRGYIHFIVIMAAEKIADGIRADWRAGRAAAPTAGGRDRAAAAARTPLINAEMTGTSVADSRPIRTGR